MPWKALRAQLAQGRQKDAQAAVLGAFQESCEGVGFESCVFGVCVCVVVSANAGVLNTSQGSVLVSGS